MNTYSVMMQTGADKIETVTVFANNEKDAWAEAMKKKNGVVKSIHLLVAY